MFSGIVTGGYAVKLLENTPSGVSLGVSLPPELITGLQTGASIAVNGVCLTVVSFSAAAESSSLVCFQAVPETLNRSNLSELKIGSVVNIERSLKFGDEVGGHPCSGHVDGMATVSSIKKIGEGAEIDFSVDSSLSKFIMEKGFVALNGASLTVAKKFPAGFRVAFIPETLSKTNFSAAVVGSRINLEIDRMTQAIVETVERVLAKDPGGPVSDGPRSSYP